MIKRTLFVVTALLFILAPSFVFADSGTATTTANRNVWSPTILEGPLVSCTGAGAAGGTDNKNCQSFCDLLDTFENVVYFGIGLVIWIFTPIMFAASGILFMFSRGNPEKVGSAKKMITGTLIGLAIVLCAYLLLNIFISVVGITGIGGFGSSACTLS